MINSTKMATGNSAVVTKSRILLTEIILIKRMYRLFKCFNVCFASNILTLNYHVALSDQPGRFNELLSLVEGISGWMLSNELKDLELNGFIHRKVDANVTPAIVEYELGAYSHSLSELVKSMSIGV